MGFVPWSSEDRSSIYNRGNYRRPVFGSADAADAFERCLFEACEQFGWQLHAYKIMGNHYHLAVTTPEPNLSDGMQWLQTTFATRFNRFRGERGHLFQGRFGSPLVEPGRSLARVASYIHLNAFRAGIVTVESMAADRWSSLRRFISGPRPKFLVCEDWLREIGLKDEAQGWSNYLRYLGGIATNKDPKQREEFDAMMTSWAIGSPAWRQAIARTHGRKSLNRGAGRAEWREVREAEWQAGLDRLLRVQGKRPGDAARDRKGATWKIEIAAALRRTTSATNDWIGRQLVMGPRNSVSQYLSEVRKGKRVIRILAA